MNIRIRNYQGYTKKQGYRKFSLVSFFILTIISLALIISDVTIHVTSLKNFLGYVFFPSQRVFSGFFYNSERVSSSIKELFSIYTENEYLRNRMNEVEQLEETQEIVIQENLRLKKVLDYKESSKEFLCSARVIGRTLDDWYKIIIVDKGSRHGVKKGDVVVLGKRILPELIGQVIEVDAMLSKVLLITDSNSEVAVYLNRTGVDGIVKGQNSVTASLKYVRADCKVVSDDKVITSGLGGIFPRGLYLGTVKKIYPDIRNTGFRNISVEPVVDFSKLRYVFIIARNEKLKFLEETKDL